MNPTVFLPAALDVDFLHGWPLCSGDVLGSFSQSADEEELLSDWFCVNPGLVSPGQVLSDPGAINLYHFTTFPPSCYFL